MSGSVTVIGGNTSTSGLVTIPSAFGADTNAALQSLLTTASGVITTNGGLTNVDQASGQTYTFGTGGIFEITNTDSIGSVTGGTSTGAYTIGSGFTGLVVQAPGSETITGNGATSVAIFGATSNVDYTVATGTGSIYAAGGNNSINVGAFGTTPTYTIATVGNDTLNLETGSNTVDASGNASTSVFVSNSNDTVVASGNATAHVVFMPSSGGTLDFINSTGEAASVYSGAYTVAGPNNTIQHEYADNAVTAYGGTGGGIYVGGLAGGNSLVGGSGTTTLIGANSGDVLSVSGGGTGGSVNQLFSGEGAETLIGGTGSGANTFELNYFYVGVGSITGNDLVSTSGSGQQAFILGAGDSTITGSTATGATNVFDLVRSASVGSANYTITNFASINGVVYVTDPNLTTGSESLGGVSSSSVGGVLTTTVSIVDANNSVSTLNFRGVGTNNLNIATDSTTGVISITYHS